MIIIIIIIIMKSRLSLIVRVNVVLNRTVVVDSDWRFIMVCYVCYVVFWSGQLTDIAPFLCAIDFHQHPSSYPKVKKKTN